MKRIFLTMFLAVSTLIVSASDCEIAMGIAPIMSGDNVPEGVARKLEARLQNALSNVGVAAGDYDCQFFITGRFDHGYTQEAGGVGGRVMVKTTLQLAICDGEKRKTYATRTFELKGVGSTDEQALTRCLSSLGAGNTAFVDFVEKGKEKIVAYFDANYQTYLSKAKNALKARDYDECLYWASCIPECCIGYNQAAQFINTAYADKTNYDSQMLLQQAQGEWAADPTAAGAEKAFAYLSQIDPSAACFNNAQALGNKIAATVKSDHDFEYRTKYLKEMELEKERIKNANQLERERIASARAIGLAWAKNQPRTVVRNNWIRW